MDSALNWAFCQGIVWSMRQWGDSSDVSRGSIGLCPHIVPTGEQSSTSAPDQLQAYPSTHGSPGVHRGHAERESCFKSTSLKTPTQSPWLSGPLNSYVFEVSPVLRISQQNLLLRWYINDLFHSSIQTSPTLIKFVFLFRALENRHLDSPLWVSLDLQTSGISYWLTETS